MTGTCLSPRTQARARDDEGAVLSFALAMDALSASAAVLMSTGIADNARWAAALMTKVIGTDEALRASDSSHHPWLWF